MMWASHIAEMVLPGNGDERLSSASITEAEGDNNFESVLLDTNNLLSAVGIAAKQISSLEELSRVASSMFVAIFESLFHTRLEDIVRNPQSKEEYVNNAQIVIDGLSDEIQMDLQHISGISVVNGDITSISHLVNLFSRIVILTRYDNMFPPSQVRVGSRRIDPHYTVSNDSISTHESTFRPTSPALSASAVESEDDFRDAGSTDRGARSSRRRARPSSSKKSASTSSSSSFSGDVESLSAPLVKDGVRRSIAIQRQNEKLQQAQRRRDAFIQTRERETGAKNRRWTEAANRIQQRRWVEEAERTEEAHRQFRTNQDSVMLRKVYAGLLKQMNQWALEEDMERKGKFSELRENALWNMKCIQAVFEDRVALLREQEIQRKFEERLLSGAQRQLSSDIRKSRLGKQKEALSMNKSVLMQQREHERTRRLESHQHLLTLLRADKWTDTLRTSVSSK